MSEVLPYLELNQDNKETIIESKTVTVPDITYKTLKEAEEILKENDLEINYEEEVDKSKKDEIIIKEQIPSSGITIKTKSKVKVSFK